MDQPQSEDLTAFRARLGRVDKLVTVVVTNRIVAWELSITDIEPVLFTSRTAVLAELARHNLEVDV